MSAEADSSRRVLTICHLTICRVCVDLRAVTRPSTNVTLRHRDHTSYRVMVVVYLAALLRPDVC